jgi:arabinogalactan oligomer/maltooligosaccharide transport system permease protein
MSTPSERRPTLLTSVLSHAFVLVLVCFALYPLLWVISLALSPSTTPEARVIPLPDGVTLDHFAAVAGRTDDDGSWLFGRQLFASIFVAGATALTAIAIATPAAYALSRFTFVGKEAGLRTLFFTQMFPTVAASVPLYLLLNAMGLLDTHAGLILVYATTAVPFAMFQLRGAFDAIPRDLEEAAMVDGATRFVAFVKVVLPAARPALAVTALFAFMSAWNEFILAATFLSSEHLYTLPMLLQSYAGEHDASWPRFAAGAVLVSMPVMALFYVLQRQLVSGLTSGGVKG